MQTRNSIGLPPAKKKKFPAKEDLPTTATPTKDENSILDKSVATSVDSKGRKKFTFADLFRDEGMYRSVNDAPVVKLLKQGPLMKTPLEQLEKYEMEHIMRSLEEDRKYNNTVFDREAMRQIVKKN